MKKRIFSIAILMVVLTTVINGRAARVGAGARGVGPLGAGRAAGKSSLLSLMPCAT